ncbi:hypothetical protein [Burkholderia gladioli]|uniref:hypothetical protein n=1 Tax=Burkholderia gladioli TaxID=28095 RepID=UPI003D1A4C5B
MPCLGAVGAERIIVFIDQHAHSLDYLSPLAMAPRLQLRAELAGSTGLNRAPVLAHQADLNTDLQAVRAWIAIRGARSDATRRAYRRESRTLAAVGDRREAQTPVLAQHARRGRIPGAVLAAPQLAERRIGDSLADRFDSAGHSLARSRRAVAAR